MVAFYLKKILSFFLEPYGFILALLFVSLVLLYRRKVRYVTYTLLFLFVYIFLLAYPPFSNLLVAPLEERYASYEYNATISYVHVLGNGNSNDYTQPLSSLASDATLKRVVEGIIIYKKQPGVKLIFSGYAGSSSLANAILNKKIAMELGVKECDIIIDPTAKDTKEEALFAKSIVANKPFVVVTSAMHMPRAMRLFESVGLHPIAAPADFEKENIDTLLRKPTLHHLQNSQKAIHEYLGILWSMLTQ